MKLEVLVAMLVLNVTLPAFASEAVQVVSQVVTGNVSVIASGSVLTIADIKTVGKVTYLTLKATANAVSNTVKISSLTAGQAALVVGETLKATTTAKGILLSAAGQVLAYVPNEMGKKVVYSAML